jgi:ABC-2 type transport system permease protein
MASGPIADLTYRNYDGPLASPRFRWWVIAKMTLRLAVKKKSLWVMMVLSGGYYFILMMILFFLEQMSLNAPTPAPGGREVNILDQFLSRIVWKDQFLHGYSFGQIWFLLIALLVGAGSIANDNRTNALLVYLAKPMDKRDYLLGKWMGVFLTLLMVMTIPTAFFFTYGALSYASYGFLSSDPWLWLKLLALLPLSAALHTSFVIGISSFFNQGRIAGAVYAATYFLSNFFTQLMVLTWTFVHMERHGQDAERISPIVSKLYYASVDGLHIGLAKGVIGTDGSTWMGIPGRIPMVPAPSLLALLAIAAGASVFLLFMAWRRIRAVEVVK